jgi:hypothetical protein
MDAHLLDRGGSGATRRLSAWRTASWYGARGSLHITEDEPRPSAWGRRRPALDRLDGHVVAGLPIVTAFPGCVYGDASGFAGASSTLSWPSPRTCSLAKPDRGVSPFMSTTVLVPCCTCRARRSQRRYYLVNRDPVLLHELAETFARLANRPLRDSRRLRAGFGSVGPVLGRLCARSDAVFSNIRLRGIGFRYRYPTLFEEDSAKSWRQLHGDACPHR